MVPTEEKRVELAQSLFSSIMTRTGAYEQIRAVEEILGLRLAFTIVPEAPKSEIILPETNIDSPSSLSSLS